MITMNTQEYAVKIVEELKNTLEKVNPIKSNVLAEKIINANKIFVAGQGRSGFAVKSFAMRLMHIGYDVYVVGETVTPNIEKGDLLIIGSGSGETATLTV
ncbi:MAG: SIS domain-containing protein, partial [Tepidanaerobacteraceae bacterium]|nr:SIS domain-containing protein [Tepidanaerobacteraceae bacterium]